MVCLKSYGSTLEGHSPQLRYKAISIREQVAPHSRAAMKVVQAVYHMLVPGKGDKCN